MYSKNTEPALSNSLVGENDLKAFGVLFGFVICFIGVVARLVFETALPAWYFCIALVFFSCAMWKPFVLRIPYKMWLGFAMALGKLNSRLILGLFFCIVFIPIGLVRRARRVDPLCRQWDGSALTYRTTKLSPKDNQYDMRFPY